MLAQPDWGDVPTWAGAGIALLGAIVAVVAGFYTRSQANSAKESLRLAEEAKNAAVDQAQSAKESVTISRAVLDQADRPTFTMAAEFPLLGEKLVPISIVMTAGPVEIIAELTWVAASREPPIGNFYLTRPTRSTASRKHELVLRKQLKVWARVPESTTDGDVKIILECTETGGRGRKWTHVENVSWERRVR